MTSPFIITECDERSSLSGQVVNVRKKINFLNKEESDNDSTYLPSVVASSSSITSDSDIETNIVRQKTRCLKNMLYLISKIPLMYVGIPEDCYFIIKQISKQTKIPIEHILLCLKKIRLNSTFSELEDNFSISLSYGSKLFLKNIPKIANVLRSFIVKLNKQSTLNTLPIAFRQNYYNVSCILDCLEIDIKKPSKALHQALTWSDYKKENTVKYLVSCTPNGLINFVSSGFGGRASDIIVLENCKFLETLEPGTVVLADRGLKHVEQMLAEEGIKLLRPPSVTTGSKLSKDVVRQTKVRASLRIHVERVIRRIREFHMLKQHAVVNAKILRDLDHCIVIACGLINLQDSLIK
ncbi:hypothetical protein WA026_008025 [Henosepilachna vigintioctopunctata]|uniref:DDE Tnp4 domain-containing protein n=1 Tax=Henosepilachna vigintioctopunctata TaxID=420089 RepID=A0AAW1TRS8_9CUCU